MFKATIKETSKELTARERLQMKDTTACVKLDAATQDAEGGLIIKPGLWAVLDIHNDKAKDRPDYVNYVVVDQETGTHYITGSESFWKAFQEIREEMEGTGEEYSVRVYRMPSKNYVGKDFLTCTVI